MVIYIKQIAFRRGVAELYHVAAQHLHDHAFNQEMCVVAAAVGIERAQRSDGKFVRVPHVEDIFFRSVLADRIRAVGRLRSIFPLGQRAVAECLGSRRKEKVFEVRHLAQARFGKIHGADQIRFEYFVGMIVAVRHRADCREMEHHLGLHFAQRTLDGELIAQIAKDNLHAMVGAQNVAARSHSVEANRDRGRRFPRDAPAIGSRQIRSLQ